jgi:hypothetical protein
MVIGMKPVDFWRAQALLRYGSQKNEPKLNHDHEQNPTNPARHCGDRGIDDGRHREDLRRRQQSSRHERTKQ